MPVPAGFGTLVRKAPGPRQIRRREVSSRVRKAAQLLMMLISVSACDMPEVKRVSCSRCSRPSSCSLAWPLPTPLGRGPFDAQSRSRVATSSFRQETQEPGLASRQREVAAAAICLQLRTRRSRVVVMLRYVRIQPCIRTYHTQLDSLTECRRLCWLYSYLRTIHDF